MLDKILKLILLLSPICYATNIRLDVFDSRFLIISAIILFCVSLFEKPIREINIAKPLGIFSGLCLFNLAIHNFSPIILSNFINIFFGIIILTIFIKHAKNPKDYYSIIVWSGLINIGVFIFQKVGFNPILDNTYKGEEGGILGNSPRLITYLALIAPFFYIKSKISLFLIVLMSLFASEYSALLTIAVCSFVMLRNKYWRILLIILSIVGVVILHKSVIYSLMIRFSLWRPILERIFDRPLVGYGLGNFIPIMTQVNNMYDYAFNDYIQLTFSFGLLGLALFGYYFKKFKEMFAYSAEEFSLLSLAILMVFEYPLEIPRIWIPIIYILGLYLIKKEDANAGY